MNPSSRRSTSTVRFFLCTSITLATSCASSPHDQPLSPDEARAGLEYLKKLEGEWAVQGGDEGPFGWTFDVTSRGTTVLERLKVGTSTEMSTAYYVDNGALLANHYCQLENQPHLMAVKSELEGDLHFACAGDVGNTDSHAELHMHGVHFTKDGPMLRVWMDMAKNGETVFETSYSLVRNGALNAD